MPRLGIDGRGLVGEVAERRPRYLRQGAGRVCLPNHPALVLLAREPRAPRRRAARAVHVGAGEDRIRAFDLAVRIEPDRGAAAPEHARCLRVLDEDEAAVVRLERGLPVWREVPWERRALHGRPPARDLPARELGRELEPVRVRREQLAVGTSARDRRCRERLSQPRRREQRGRAAQASRQEVPAPQAVCRVTRQRLVKRAGRPGLARGHLYRRDASQP